MIHGTNVIDDFDEISSHIDKLLNQEQQYWAIQLCNTTIKEIQTSNLSNSEIMRRYTILIDLWEHHLRVLVKNFYANWPLIYNAYNFLFEILFLIQDFSRLIYNGLRLAKVLVKIGFSNDFSIANFLDSLAIFTARADYFKETIELLLLSLFFKKNYQRNDYFERTLAKLSEILRKIAHDQRPILLKSVSLNIYQQFFEGSIKYIEFIETIYLVSLNKIDKSVQEAFHILIKEKVHLMDPGQNLDLTQQTIVNLQMIKENSWAYSIVQNYCEELKNNNELSKAKKFLREFIKTCYRQGSYQTAFLAYEHLATFFTNFKGFPTYLVSIWAEAAKKFRNLKDKKYFVRAIKEYRDLLIVPDDYYSFKDYCYARNEYYLICRGHIFTSKEDFWWAALHRGFFEEGYLEIVTLSAKQLGIQDHPCFIQLIEEQLPFTINRIKERRISRKEADIGGMMPSEILLKLRIPSRKPIKLFSEIYYKSGFSKMDNIETKEYWDEPYLNELYLNLPVYGTTIDNATHSEKNETVILEQQQFGMLAYLFLPQNIRDFIEELNLRSDHTPEVYVIMDEPNFPLEMLNDQRSSFGSKFAFGYRFREPKLAMEKIKVGKSQDEINLKFTMLSIGDLNQKFPHVWNEEEQQYCPLFKFQNGEIQRKFIEEKINNLQNLVDRFSSIDPSYSSKDSIEKEITSGIYNIIHISANMFYLDQNPSQSYFLTSNNEVLSIQEIIDMLSYAKQRNELQGLPYFRPLLILDVRIIDESNKSIPRFFTQIYNITKSISSRHFIGIFARISNEFNDMLKLYLGEFINHIFLNESIGSAHLKVNKQLFNISQSFSDENEEDSRLKMILRESHYVFIGDPSLKLE
ncbi:hypothetical protein NEF87_003931 [Candidatus Lokiarchaeum ossiferum]|uniref:CHAT domain-containing protein n=1 Tax=Candidatus Lokiarchaeum ossiferum TaxID=2951803 RepID=A0ABY6HW84_9ARCH|nr:hypothetical protein NEF87_003931 [Candidatus Lokiarchaeum sp. B-35]